jgi:hypothetical protein
MLSITETAKRKSTRRERLTWYIYDFGNSAYAAVVLLAVYSAYFQAQVVGGAEGSRLWGRSIAHRLAHQCLCEVKVHRSGSPGKPAPDVLGAEQLPNYHLLGKCQ